MLITDSIFVSIPSYRDCECIHTLEDLFRKAHHPERLTVGICQQNNPMLDDNIDVRKSKIFEKHKDQIRLIDMDALDAKGPMYARYLIEQHLFADEMFYLQIDSHTLFVQGWDTELIKQLLLCDSDRPILTTYPHDFDRKTRRLPICKGTYLRFRDFHPRLGFTQQERRDYAIEPKVPQPSLFWAAGFSFTLGEAVRQVPYDPNCPFVFIGEEQSMNIRFFTHGWDFFAPTKNIIFHLMMRTYRPKFWEQVYRKNCVVDTHTRLERKMEEQMGVERLHRLINCEFDDNDEFGLGNERTVQEWEEFVGVDIAARRGSHRSFLGLTPNATPDEQMIKLGQLKQRSGGNGNNFFVKSV